MRTYDVGDTVAVNLDLLSPQRQQRHRGTVTEVHADGQITAQFPQDGAAPMTISGPADHFIAVRTERKGSASLRLAKARIAAERLLAQEQNHSGSGRDGHLNEADLVPLFEALGAVYLDDPEPQVFEPLDVPPSSTRPSLSESGEGR